MQHDITQSTPRLSKARILCGTEAKISMLKIIPYTAHTGKPYYITWIDNRRYYVVALGGLRGKIETLPKGRTIKTGTVYYIYDGDYIAQNDAIFIGE